MRCGLCGSKEVSLVNKSSYSMKKGIVGAVVLGPVGAVAGINGNSSMVYHCMKCGQDSLSIMDNYFEQAIDTALSNGDRATLDRYRSSWRNIEYPTNVSKNMSTSTILVREDSKNSTSLIGDISLKELKIRIREDISSSTIPYTYDEIVEKYNDNIKAYDAINEILKEGLARRTYINGKEYISPARTPEEIQQFALMEAARPRWRDIDNERDIEKDIINIIAKNNNEVGMLDLQEEFAELHPELFIANNPYSITSFVESIVFSKATSGEIIDEGGIIKLPSLLEREAAIYNEIVDRAKQRNRLKHTLPQTEVQNIKLKNEILDVLAKSFDDMSVDDIKAASYMLSDISNQKCLALLMRIVEDHNAEKIVTKYKSLFRITPNYTRYQEPSEPSESDACNVDVLHNSNWGISLFNAISKHEGEQLDLIQIIDIVNKDENKSISGEIDINDHSAERLYIELLYYEKRGFFKKTEGSNGNVWIFVDKTREEKEKVNKQIEQLSSKIRELNDSRIEAESEYNTRVDELKALEYKGNPELEKKIGENSEKIRELEGLLPSLNGFFKKRKKEECLNEIKKLEEENTSFRNTIEEEKRSANNAIAQKKNELHRPIDNIDAEVNQCQNELKKAETDLEKLQNPLQDDIKKAELLSSRMSSTQQENEVAKEKMYNYLKSHSPLTVSEIQLNVDEVKDFSHQKTSALLRQLATENKVVKKIEGNKTLFSAL